MGLQYRRLNDYFNDIFPGKVRKIAINANLGCPNRDGTIGTGGCIYCNNQSFNPSYAVTTGNITEQIEQGIRFSERKGKAWGYLPFFQAYTNTYGNFENLISMYEEALKFPNVAGLVIATRPDCITNDLLDWMEMRFGNKAPSVHPFLLVELGVESTNDITLKAINRGHNYTCVIETAQKLHEKGIETGAHIILGLPGENHEDFITHAKRISELPISTLKLHQLQIVKGTALAEQYAKDPTCVKLFTPQSYAQTVKEFIGNTRPDIAFDRFVSEIPQTMLIAPKWGLKPSEFQDLLETL